MAKITNAEKVAEILKCGKDPVHFIRRWVYIQHPQRGRIKFETYPFQDDVVQAMQDHRLNIVLKSRQLGLSTILAAYSLWLALFHKDKNVLVIATKLATAETFIRKVKAAIEYLPDWMKIAKPAVQSTQIIFDNGSRIVAIPTTPDAGRSEAISLLIIDEAAFIRDFDTIWTGLAPTISTGGNVCILSTPNGIGGQYHRLWVDAESGRNDFNAIKLPWYVHPEHDDEWLKQESKSYSKRQMNQEFFCTFLGSGETFLNVEDLEWIQSQIKEPVAREGYDKNVWIWSEPIAGRRYVMPADVARGDAKDFSVFHVIDVDDCTMVAEYMGKAPPEKLAAMMAEYGRRYNDALAVPENNSFGYTTATWLRDNDYPSLYYDKNKSDPFNGTFDVKPDELPGFSTQLRSRLNVLTKLEELIRNKVFVSHSSRLVNQLNTFIWDNNKPKAMGENHDDLILSVAIGLYVSSPALVNIETSSSKHHQAMLMATSRIAVGVDKIPGMERPMPLTSTYVNVATENRQLASPRGTQVINRLNPNWKWLLR